jgi:hypothetical protein
VGGQFLLNGVSRGEKILFTTLTNTRDKLLALADSHRWSLSPDKSLFPHFQKSTDQPRACITPIAKSRFEKIILYGCVVAHFETQKSLMNPSISGSVRSQGRKPILVRNCLKRG